MLSYNQECQLLNRFKRTAIDAMKKQLPEELHKFENKNDHAEVKTILDNFVEELESVYR